MPNNCAKCGKPERAHYLDIFCREFPYDVRQFEPINSVSPASTKEEK